MQIRREEDLLFKEMASPPNVLEGVHDVLADAGTKNEDIEERFRASRKRKCKINDVTQEKRPRGRPRNVTSPEAVKEKKKLGRPKKNSLKAGGDNKK